MRNITLEFLDEIDKIANLPVPEKVLERAKNSLLDYLCVTSAGAFFQKDKLKKYLEFAEPEDGKYTAIGMDRKVNLKEAVYLNGLNGHALDYDDGTNTGIIHLGSPVFSVLLPLAEKYGYTLEEVLRAAIIGYEASFTMALSIQPGHKLMGYHATGTCGILGTVLAASYMLGFTQEERENAFATACVSATGMLKVLDDGSELKPYNVAKTALLALISIQMAKAGYKGHPDPLAGERGYLKMMTGQSAIELKKPLYKGTYAIEKTYTKPYAACRYCHPSIEAAIRIRQKYQIKPDEIAHIFVKTYELAVNKHDHTVVPTSASAKMSIPYSVAAGFIYGKAGLTEYDETYVKSEEMKKLTSKVSVVSDKDFTDAFPAVTTAVVKVTAASGNVYEERVDFPKGEPENPMSEDEFKDRFEQLLIYAGRDEHSIREIYAFVKKAEGTINELMKFM